MGDSFEQAVEAVDGLHARATALDGVEFAFYVSAIREPKAGLQAVLLGGHAVFLSNVLAEDELRAMSTCATWAEFCQLFRDQLRAGCIISTANSIGIRTVSVGMCALECMLVMSRQARQEHEARVLLALAGASPASEAVSLAELGTLRNALAAEQARCAALQADLAAREAELRLCRERLASAESALSRVPSAPSSGRAQTQSSRTTSSATGGGRGSAGDAVVRPRPLKRKAGGNLINPGQVAKRPRLGAGLTFVAPPPLVTSEPDGDEAAEGGAADLGRSASDEA